MVWGWLWCCPSEPPRRVACIGRPRCKGAPASRTRRAAGGEHRTGEDAAQRTLVPGPPDAKVGKAAGPKGSSIQTSAGAGARAERVVPDLGTPAAAMAAALVLRSACAGVPFAGACTFRAVPCRGEAHPRQQRVINVLPRQMPARTWRPYEARSGHGASSARSRSVVLASVEASACAAIR